jgi:(E)-4-hydroxy-3-methyl-but-2-enyl pyrophosphate reductase
MPTTIRARIIGMCPGVIRALRLVDRAADSGDRVATIGTVVHNRRVVARLEERGVAAMEDVPVDFSGTIVTRSHGVRLDVLEPLRRRGIDLIDGTCPKVARIHRIAEETEASGEMLLVVGERSHPEVSGIVSRAGDWAIVSTVDDARSVSTFIDSVVVVAQTTFGRDRYSPIIAVLNERFPGARVVDTICSETDERNRSVRELGDVDAIIVVGDRDSSNTRRLYEAAVATRKPSWRVEGAADIPREIARMKLVGITAGASTPEWVIEEVEEAIHGIDDVGSDGYES